MINNILIQLKLLLIFLLSWGNYSDFFPITLLAVNFIVYLFPFFHVVGISWKVLISFLLRLLFWNNYTQSRILKEFFSSSKQVFKVFLISQLCNKSLEGLINCNLRTYNGNWFFNNTNGLLMIYVVLVCITLKMLETNWVFDKYHCFALHFKIKVHKLNTGK